MRVATIGVGSNSVRMLVADIVDGQAHTICRDRAGTRLFACLDEKGNLDIDQMMLTLSSVEAFADKAQALNAEDITVFATSAVRDAGNKQVFLQEVQKRTHVIPDVLSGQSEAALSFLGAADLNRLSGVIDIGGGSTELAIGIGGQISFATSLQLGAVRLKQWAAIERAEDVSGVTALCKSILLKNVSPHEAAADKWVGVGGTFTTLAAIVNGLVWTDTTCVHNLHITLQDAGEVARRLAPMTREERLEVKGMRPQRADIVVHGICILIACMEALSIGSIQVSENGNLNGYIAEKYKELFTKSLK